jgi:hypothetical protein
MGSRTASGGAINLRYCHLCPLLDAGVRAARDIETGEAPAKSAGGISPSSEITASIRVATAVIFVTLIAAVIFITLITAAVIFVTLVAAAIITVTRLVIAAATVIAAAIVPVTCAIAVGGGRTARRHPHSTRGAVRVSAAEHRGDALGQQRTARKARRRSCGRAEKPAACRGSGTISTGRIPGTIIARLAIAGWGILRRGLRNLRLSRPIIPWPGARHRAGGLRPLTASKQPAEKARRGRLLRFSGRQLFLQFGDTGFGLMQGNVLDHHGLHEVIRRVRNPSHGLANGRSASGSFGCPAMLPRRSSSLVIRSRSSGVMTTFQRQAIPMKPPAGPMWASLAVADHEPRCFAAEAS